VSGEIFLDSSVVVPYFRRDPAIGQQIRNHRDLYVSVTVVGELYCGAYLSSNQPKVLNEIRSFLNGVAVLSPTDATANHYGKIRAALAKAGTPIPENDIWIAATAIEYNLPLAARDEHFKFIAGLNVISW
jgi:tRNA(fMet)-specific endonuclease VapC